MTIGREISKIKNANSSSQVLLFVAIKRNNKFRMKSGIFVNSDYWNAKKGCLTIPKKVGADLRDSLNEQNDQLDELTKRITEIVRILGEEVKKEEMEECLKITADHKGAITKELLTRLQREHKSKLERGKRREKCDIYKLSEVFCNEKKYSEGRARHCKVVFRCMERYEKIYTKRIRKTAFTWDIDSITPDDMRDFFSYIENEHIYMQDYASKYKNVDLIYHQTNKCQHRNVVQKERGENRLVTIRKIVKTFWRWLIKNEYTTNDPLKNISAGTEKFGEPWFLTIAERNTILHHDFSDNKRMETQRDIFIFQCLVGCRVGDLLKLTADNIVDNMLIYIPHKTHDHANSRSVRVPLSEIANQLITKYDHADSKGRLFPYIAEQNYNEAIKDILTECEITRSVPIRDSLTGETVMKPLNEIASSHMARRTFCGNIYKQVADPSLIGKMSGHVEGSKAFARYRNIDDDMLRNTINLIQ